MLGELTVQDLWWLARTAAEQVNGPAAIQASYANRFATWIGLAQTTFAGAVFAYLALAANYLTSAAAKPPPSNSDSIAIGVSVLAILLTIVGIVALVQASRSSRLYVKALKLFVQFSP
jgi:cell division protein FtsX